jgi:ferredoxin
MFNLLDRWLNTNPVNVLQSRCVKSRYKRSSCRKCIVQCPQKALYFEGQIKTDESVCSGCGICVNICPTGVFELNNNSYIKLFNRIDNNGTIEFSCQESASGGVKVPCLGFLSLSFLISLLIAKKKSVIINISECQDCSNQTGLKVIHETVGNARSMIDVLGLDVDICLGSNNSINENEPGCSRREFFMLFRDRAAGKVSDVINIVNSQVPEDLYREQKIPEHRKLLLHFWPELLKKAQKPSSYAPFAQIEIGPECNLCNVCVKACPAGALIRSEGDSKVTLQHNIDFCVQCGLCREICPRRAVKYLESVELSIFNRKLKVELREFPKSHCRECGRDFIAANDGLLCNACSAKKQLADEFFGDIN